MLYIKYIEKTFSSVKGKYVLCKASMKTKGKIKLTCTKSLAVSQVNFKADGLWDRHAQQSEEMTGE